MVRAARASSLQEAESLTLRLASYGIASRAVETPEGWDILVPSRSLASALEALREPAVAQSEVKARWSSTGWVVAALLVCLHLLGSTLGREHLLLSAGCSGFLLRRGQWYRAVASLFVHANFLHLTSNAVAMAVLLSGLASEVGSGVAVMVTLLAGAGGGAAAGLLRGSLHLCVGASGAVFGALGALASLRFVASTREDTARKAKLMPLAAALALLAMLGSDPQTDVLSHLTGFAAGTLLGLPCAFLGERRRGPLTQVGALAGALGLTGLAWWKALTH